MTMKTHRQPDSDREATPMSRIGSPVRDERPGLRSRFGGFLLLASLGACAGATPGPDKQFAGELRGAVTGAGAGAVTGFQLGAGSGPGALVGAGLGAVAGGISGAMTDATEEASLALSRNVRVERERATVHEVLQDHYVRRMELHPSRDIYPADLFFNGDAERLCPSAVPIVKEIARLTKHRMPWSRFVVASYVRSGKEPSAYAKHLAEARAKEIADALIKYGVEPRRVLARGVVVDAPLVKDPYDHPDRYSQAIEFLPSDR